MPDTLLPPTDPPLEPGPSTPHHSSPQGSPVQNERTQSALLLGLPSEPTSTGHILLEEESVPSLTVSERPTLSVFPSTAGGKPAELLQSTGTSLEVNSEPSGDPNNDTLIQGHSPATGLSSFIDVFVERVGKFLRQ